MGARNEASQIGMTARGALEWLDHLVVSIHASTDDTERICGEIAVETHGRLTIIHEDDPVWREMQFRQRMLETARELGATHIAYIDADEILSANLVTRARGIIESMPQYLVWSPPWIGLIGNKDNYLVSGWYASYSASLVFADEPALYWAAAADGFDHHRRVPMGRLHQPYHFPLRSHDPLKHGGGLLHLQLVNERNLKIKQLWYQCVEKSRWGHVRSNYVGTVRDATTALNGICPASWWAGYENLLQYFHPETPGWHEAEVRRMLAENPGLGVGLDDFGMGLLN